MVKLMKHFIFLKNFAASLLLYLPKVTVVHDHIVMYVAVNYSKFAKCKSKMYLNAEHFLEKMSSNGLITIVNVMVLICEHTFSCLVPGCNGVNASFRS